MLDSHAMQTWMLAKESFPEAIVFTLTDGLFVVVDKDAGVLCRVCHILTDSRFLGFEPVIASAHARQLLQAGHRVVVAKRGSIREVVEHRHEPTRCRGGYLALDALLLFDRHELEGSVRSQSLLQSFSDWLAVGNLRAIQEFGSIAVYPVGAWYEIDAELTTMLPAHVKLLAQAALATHSRLPCYRAVNKPRKNRPSHQVTTHTATMPLGQMRLL